MAATARAESDPSIVEQINEANRLLREQKITEAIDAFGEIDDSQGQYRDTVNYNLGVTHYRNGDFAAAQMLFANSAQSKQIKIAAQSRYNLGNCHYSQALNRKDQEPQAAITELQTAITHFRSSLRLDESNSDARANIELASQLIRQLKAEQADHQEQQEQQEASDDSSSNGEQQQGGNSKDQDHPIRTIRPVSPRTVPKMIVLKTRINLGLSHPTRRVLSRRANSPGKLHRNRPNSNRNPRHRRHPAIMRHRMIQTASNTMVLSSGARSHRPTRNLPPQSPSIPAITTPNRKQTQRAN